MKIDSEYHNWHRRWIGVPRTGVAAFRRWLCGKGKMAFTACLIELAKSMSDACPVCRLGTDMPPAPRASEYARDSGLVSVIA